MRNIFEDIKLLQLAGIFIILFLIGAAFLGFFFQSLTETLPEATAEHAGDFANLNLLFGFASVICIGGVVLILLKRKKNPQYEEDERYVLKRIR